MKRLSGEVWTESTSTGEIIRGQSQLREGHVKGDGEPVVCISTISWEGEL